ncbi:MAG: endonuclease/exonuclease/phosphatase family protein [Candidatus Binatia bacterium]
MMKTMIPCLVVVAALAASVPRATSAATDVPVAGKGVGIGARKAARHTFVFRSEVDTSVVAPFPDPTTGASLRVFVSSAEAQCHAEIALPANHWRPISGNGAQKGWRYRDASGSAQGVRAVTLSARRAGGRIAITARGAFPCGLEAEQTAPVHVELRMGETRYCAAFGGTTVRTNKVGRYRAIGAPAPDACLDDDITLADLNVLHGIFCPADTVGCRRADRIELLRQFVVARGCPDVLAFQEGFNLGGAFGENLMALQAALTNACPIPYVSVYDGLNPFDNEMIFSRYPLLIVETFDLLGPLRHLFHVRIDHPVGALDVYATHLASGGDLATGACGVAFGTPCPPDCIAAGAATVRDCQAVQVAKYVETSHDVATAALLVGDFNETPGSFVYAQFAGRGWTDAHLAAGNPECDTLTGVGCTSGRQDEALTDLEDPALHQIERIDFIWVVPPGPGSICSAIVEAAGDGDGDGIATRLFADEPNPFAPACGPSPAAICWSSDHTGVQADLNCH